MQIVVYNGELPPIVYERVSKYQYILDMAEVIPHWVQITPEPGDPKTVLGYLARLARKAKLTAHRRRNHLFIRNHTGGT